MPETPALRPTDSNLIRMTRPNRIVDLGVAEPSWGLASQFDIAPNRLHAGTSLFFAASAAAFVAFLWWGTFARQETVKGYVSAASHVSRLDATQAGVVAQIAVAIGDPIKAGQVLLTLERREPVVGGVGASHRQTAQLGQRRTTLEAEKARRERRIAGTEADLRRLDEETALRLALLAEQEPLLNEALATEKEWIGRLSGALTNGSVSRESLAQHQRQALEFQRQIFELAQKRGDVERTAQERRELFENRRLEDQRATAEVDIELTEIENRRLQADAARAIEIVAPVDGLVTSLGVAPGSVVNAGDFLLSLAPPDAARQIVLEAPSRAMGLVEIGQRVVLKYDAFPFKTFGVKHGVITSVSQAPQAFVTVAQPETDKGGKETTFRIYVEPVEREISAYGQPRRPPLGSSLTADVVVERRRLIDWVLDPIHAMRGRT